MIESLRRALELRGDQRLTSLDAALTLALRDPALMDATMANLARPEAADTVAVALDTALRASIRRQGAGASLETALTEAFSDPAVQQAIRQRLQFEGLSDADAARAFTEIEMALRGQRLRAEDARVPAQPESPLGILRDIGGRRTSGLTGGGEQTAEAVVAGEIAQYIARVNARQAEVAMDIAAFRTTVDNATALQHQVEARHIYETRDTDLMQRAPRSADAYRRSNPIVNWTNVWTGVRRGASGTWRLVRFRQLAESMPTREQLGRLRYETVEQRPDGSTVTTRGGRGEQIGRLLRDTRWGWLVASMIPYGVVGTLGAI
ncbi:TPA: hypothetical protein EYP38_02960, partial [Candidatus Micrarchaeota archaeon]|nr:hypothetical protein [Candidatus Micrarchaeota archaeon]